jgi:hypothetical protein
MEIKNAWNFTPFPFFVFTAWYLDRGTSLIGSEVLTTVIIKDSVF